MTGEEPSTATSAAAAEQSLARLVDLARKALRTQVILAKQSADLARGTLSGDLDRTSAGKAYVEAVSREGARFWRALGELSVDYATEVITLGDRLSTKVLREAAAAGRPGKPSNGATTESPRSASSRTSGGESSPVPERNAQGRRVAVSLYGSVGGRAEGTVTVANQHPRPRRIQLTASDVVDSTGAVVGAALDVSPATVTVPGGKERPVSLGVDLNEGSFSAGKRYSCTVDVSGGDEATIEVSIEIRD